jgi:uracil-DNA glycosylase
MSRRDDMLREMGLTPVWRLRGAAGATSPSAETAPAAQAARADVPAAPDVRRSPVDAPAAHATDAPADARRAVIMRMDWTTLKERVSGCVDCRLHEQRNRTVFGVGDEKADWLFVGEGPGADEDQQGEPFVGQAGKLLDNMLAAMRLKRGENVYIANIVKCRPPGNRNPAPDEARQCEPYLERQIELLRPRLIVALGKIAAVNLMGRDASIASLRGKVHDYMGIPLIVTYHPAYLLRTLPDKAKAWADLCFALTTMQGLQTQARVPT